MLDIIKETTLKIKENPTSYLIGSIIDIFWFLLIPYIFILGYLDRFMFSESYGISKLPKWSNVKNLIFRGFKLLAIIIIYLAPSFILILYTANTNASISLSNVKSAYHISPIEGVGIILFVIMSFLLIGAIANYIRKGKLADAFNIKDIIYLMIIYPKQYIKTYLWLFLINFFSLFIIIIPVVGLIIFGFVNFFILLVGYTAIIKLGGVRIEKSKGLQTQEEYYY